MRSLRHPLCHEMTEGVCTINELRSHIFLTPSWTFAP